MTFVIAWEGVYMFSVLLIDDEPWALRGIERSFHWEDKGFSVIGKTTDPFDALELVMNRRVDVIFIDVRMPELSGIDIIKKARAANISSEFVIVSGYSEFDYAKNAMRYDVYDYLLKPIDVQEGNELLERLSLYLKKKQNIERYTLKLSYLDRILSKEVAIEAMFQEKGVICSYDKFQFVMIDGLTTHFDIKCILDSKDIEFIDMKTGENKYLYIINCREDISNSFQKKLIQEKLLANCNIGIGTLFDSSDNLFDKFREADEASYNSFITGENGLYCYRENDRKNLVILLKRLIVAIDQKNQDMVQKILTGELLNLFKVEKLNLSDLVFFYNQIISYLNYEYYSRMRNIDLSFMDYEQIVKQFTNINSFCKVLCDSILYLLDEGKNRQESANENFKELLEYVNLNYNQTIRLDDLSSQFYISPTYICDLFRKHTDRTLTEYILDLRMTEASAMLKGTDMLVSQIASKVGYNDYYYFSRLFKKYYGISPTEYRENGREHYV